MEDWEELFGLDEDLLEEERQRREEIAELEKREPFDEEFLPADS